MDGFTSFSWTRPLVTGDTEEDNALEFGMEYYLQWAIGIYNDDGGLYKHGHDERGQDLITLFANYQDDTYATSDVGQTSLI